MLDYDYVAAHLTLSNCASSSNSQFSWKTLKDDYVRPCVERAEVIVQGAQPRD